MVGKGGGQSLKAATPEQQMIDKEMVPKDMSPEELRVLAVDDDPVTLKIIEAQLRHCHYKVTKTTEATTALKLLREDKNAFDIVITDVVHLHDMDGFELLEIIGLEMDLPVIMISVDDNPSKVRKGIKHGACDYLVKPIRLEEIKNIWQHVFRKSKLGKSDLKVENVAVDLKQKKRNNNQLNENETNADDQHSAPKKPRFSWSPDLHQKFVDAYDKLGPDKAIPSKILKELRYVPNITREIVASHLQKYRIGLKKTMSKKSNVTVASSGMSGQLFTATDLSIDKKGQTGIKSFTGTRANVYSSSQFGHHIQNGDALCHSFVNPTSHLRHLNQQSILARQCPPKVVDEYRQRIQVHEVSDIPSNSIMMGNVHHQKYLNGFNSVSFSSRSRICNANYMEIPSKMPDYNASSYQLLGCTSNPLPIHSSTDFAGCAMLDDATSSMLCTVVQNDYGIRAAPNFLPGQNEERYIVHTKMESCSMEHSIRTDQKPLVQHPFELRETDSTNQLSSCSSTDDDLTAAIKQFQQ